MWCVCSCYAALLCTVSLSSVLILSSRLQQQHGLFWVGPMTLRVLLAAMMRVLSTAPCIYLAVGQCVMTVCYDTLEACVCSRCAGVVAVV